MKPYIIILDNLENELKQASQVSEKLSEQIEFAIGHCKIALDELRELVGTYGFPDREGEILFFKKLKPRVCSKLLFFQMVVEIEAMRPDCSVVQEQKLLHHKLRKALKYLRKHNAKVQYFHNGYTHLDEKYFTLKNGEIPFAARDYSTLVDENFSSWRDHAFSVILATEMFIEYLNKELIKLDDPEGMNLLRSRLRWTGRKIDLYELIYGIYLDGSVNNGKVTIKELTEGFEWMFNVELQKEVYKTQEQLIKRSDPVKYLERLVDILRRRINHKLK